ncbi:hypothetical protein L1887_12988 [Cichorium endivia]|nr:hypothetical protein L1887_12988 [Cichorium endivia]
MATFTIDFSDLRHRHSTVYIARVFRYIARVFHVIVFYTASSICVTGVARIGIRVDVVKETIIKCVTTVEKATEKLDKVSFQGKGAVQKKVNALRELRRLLSKSEYPPVETAIKSGAIPLLAQCLSFGSQDDQLLANLKKQELCCLHYPYSLLILEVSHKKEFSGRLYDTRFGAKLPLTFFGFCCCFVFQSLRHMRIEPKIFTFTKVHVSDNNSGRWDAILPQVAQLRLPRTKLGDLYEQEAFHSDKNPEPR